MRDTSFSFSAKAKDKRLDTVHEIRKLCKEEGKFFSDIVLDALVKYKEEVLDVTLP